MTRVETDKSNIFQTNNIEGLWSQIKRLCHNFSGININFKLYSKFRD